ncbi:hypothetical protein, partial [Bordetella pertussis]|uniref:hypothetical protein n=1 Tax=Bordetella pertussis TaxID=520 RepID=UPI0019D6FCA7
MFKLAHQIASVDARHFLLGREAGSAFVWNGHRAGMPRRAGDTVLLGAFGAAAGGRIAGGRNRGSV